MKILTKNNTDFNLYKSKIDKATDSLSHNKDVELSKDIFKSNLKHFHSLLAFSSNFNKSNNFIYERVDKLNILEKSGVKINPYLKVSNSDIKTDELVKSIEDKLTSDLSPDRFGDLNNPLVLSIKGKQSTVYVGLNDEIVGNMLTNSKSDESFKKYIYQNYNSFLQNFGHEVFGINYEKFSEIDDKISQNLNNLKSNESIDQIKANKYKLLIEKESGRPFPQEVQEQLLLATDKLSESNSNLLVEKTSFIQSHTSNEAIGVLYTNDPSSGLKKLSGCYTDCKTPQHLVSGDAHVEFIEELKDKNQNLYKQLRKVASIAEKSLKKPQSISFKVCNGEITVVDVKDLNMSPFGKIKATVSLAEKNVITGKEALANVSETDVNKSLTTQFDKNDLADKSANFFGLGLGASQGAACGIAVFDNKKAEELISQGLPVILIKSDTNIEDIDTLLKSNASIIVNAGLSSHAAIVARGAAKPCVLSLLDSKINENEGILSNKTSQIKEGEWISVDGSSGQIFKDKIKITKESPKLPVVKLLDMADKEAPLQVYANADTPEDILKSLNMGAKGVGLCRTEHMFFKNNRAEIFQKAILSEKDSVERKEALKKLEDFQYEDFKAIFESLKDKPITIRLLDPPLDEFLPDLKAMSDEFDEKSSNWDLQKKLDYLKNYKEVKAKVDKLTESNPMMGNRGSRLGITNPDLYEMQIKAIMRAALETNAIPKIMLPMISTPEEFEFLAANLRNKISEILKESNLSSDKAKEIESKIKIGTMIELPSAALLADRLAQSADFFSVGTNDLTQFTLGYSRNDSNSFLNIYKQNGIIDKDPAQVLHPAVKELIHMAVSKARMVKPDFQISICGEQAANSQNSDFFKDEKITYLSCSPAKIYNTRLFAGKSNKISFGAAHSKMFKDFQTLVDSNFKNNLRNFYNQCSFTSEELKLQLTKEYDEQTCKKIELSGDRVGFNNLILIIPGIKESGNEVDLLPVVTSSPNKCYMGGGHWMAESYFVNDLISDMHEKNLDFSIKNRTYAK